MKARTAALFVGGLLTCASTGGARAQVGIRALVVSSCGQQAFPLGTAASPIYEPFTILPNGNFCISGGGGGAVTQGTTPWVDNITQWAGTALGNPTAYGTAPSGNAPGVNAYVTDFPATQAVTWTGQSVGISGSLPAGTNALGSVSVSNFPTTQVISGTVTANQGTPASTANAWPTTDTNAAQTITAPGTAAAKAQGIQGVSGGLAIAESLADGADTTLGSKADAASAATGSSLMAIERQLHADLIAPTPAGTAIIGKVGIDQTTPGVTNAVTNSPSTGGTLTTSQPSVTTTAAALAFSGTVHREIYNPAASTASIFIGGSGVTTTTGWEIPPGASYDVSRFSGSVYAIAASSQTVRLISY